MCPECSKKNHPPYAAALRREYTRRRTDRRLQRVSDYFCFIVLRLQYIVFDYTGILAKNTH